MWSFRQAPPAFRELFPEGAEDDWIACVPSPESEVLQPLMRLWNSVYPIGSRELPDRSVVYWGAPRRAMQWIIKHGSSVSVRPPAGEERRAAVRAQIVCPSRYETHGEPRQSGVGHTIDMSGAGIAFTTESLLPANTKITLYVTWPVRLEGGVPVELRAVGRLARTGATRAALQLERMSFSIVE
jgi:hypothetical protein